MRADDGWPAPITDPVVRPYALTGGRTQPAGGAFLDLLAVVVTAGSPAAPGDPAGLSPEHRAIVGLCHKPVTVADLAADIALPLGVVRVLLDDLVVQGLINALPPWSQGEQPSAGLLKEVLHGLRAL